MILSVHSIFARISLDLESQVPTKVVILFDKGAAAFALMVGLESDGTEVSRQNRIHGILVFIAPRGLLIRTLASAAAQGLMLN